MAARNRGAGEAGAAVSRPPRAPRAMAGGGQPRGTRTRSAPAITPPATAARSLPKGSALLLASKRSSFLEPPRRPDGRARWIC